MSTRSQADHYFLIFCTLPWSYLTSNLNLIGWLWWCLYLRRHGLFHIHYIHFELHCHLFLMDMSPFRYYVAPYLIPDKVIPRWWQCPRMTFSFPSFLPLYLHWIRIILCLIEPLPHLQQAPLLRVVPSVGYPRVPIPWSLREISQTGTLVRI